MKKKSLFVLFPLFLFYTKLGLGQKKEIFKRGKNDTIPVAVVVENGEYIPWVASKEVTIADKRTFTSEVDRQYYLRLRRNVLRVLPYARLARVRYQKLERDIASTSDKKKHRILIKQCETEIKDLFTKELKKLSINQGSILIKLIDRETSHTSYELVKELKGGLSAFFLQSLTKMFGNDLKSEYNPEQERDIESILASIGYNSLK